MWQLYGKKFKDRTKNAHSLVMEKKLKSNVLDVGFPIYTNELTMTIAKIMCLVTKLYQARN